MACLHLNPNVFFIIENDKVLAWNYNKHEQFLLNKKYFLELLNVSSTGECLDKSIAEELQNANLISYIKFTDNIDWGWDILSKIFHKGTQDVYTSEESSSTNEFIKEYINKSTDLPSPPAFFLEKKGTLIDLPEPNIQRLKDVSLFSALINRKTSRNFNKEFISIEDLSLILYVSFGLIHGKEWEDFTNSDLKTVGCRKASPASGALHAGEAYVIAYRVNELEQGIYHYRPHDHKLTRLARGDYEEKIIEANYNQFYSEGLASGIYLTCRFDKLWWKYKHSRSLKVALLDLGHLSQTFLLTSTALNLKTWITAAFQDSLVNNLIQVDGTQESALLFLGIGHGKNHTIPEAMLQRFK